MDRTGSIYNNLKNLVDKDGQKIVEIKKEIFEIEGIPTEKAVVLQKVYKVENGELDFVNKKVVDDNLISAKIAGHQAEIDALLVLKADIEAVLNTVKG
jgi:hypothetical protein